MVEKREILRQGQDSFLTTTVDAVVNWGRKYSFFLYPFVTACCGMEFMSAAGPRYDLDRFGCAPAASALPSAARMRGTFKIAESAT